MDDFFRQNLASLKGSEVKILIAMMIHGRRPNAELMRLSGITNRATYYGSLNHLRSLGAIPGPHLRGWETLQNDGERFDFQTVGGAGTTPDPVGKPYQQGNPTGGETQPKWGNQTRSGGETQPNDIESAIALADEMEADGDERDTRSPFQVRRKRQIELIQQAWRQLFNEDLNPLAAKQLLQTAHSQATDVYGAMLAAAERNVQYKQAYVKKMLEGNASKPAATVLHKNMHKADSDGPGDLRPVTQEQRDSWDEMDRKLKASGLLNGWDL